MCVKNEITSSKKADFVVNGYTFKIDGKNKKQTQIEQDEQFFVVKDCVDFGYRNVLPLWAFGLNY